MSHGVTIEGGLLTALSSGFVAIIGAGSVWLAQRLVGKAAWQNALTAGAKDLIDQLQEERAEYQKIIRTMRDEWATERLATAGERSSLRGEIINLTQVIEGLKTILRNNGIPVPGPTHHIAHAPGEQVMIVLEQQALDDTDDGCPD
jgi:hypothetical protein